MLTNSPTNGGKRSSAWTWTAFISAQSMVVPYLRGRKGSNIINISSVVGMVPFRNQVAFTAAKAGVINMTKAMALELADDDIRVNCIAPGTICMDKTAALWAKDDSMKRLLDHIPQHRQGDPDEIAYPPSLSPTAICPVTSPASASPWTAAGPAAMQEISKNRKKWLYPAVQPLWPVKKELS